MLIFIGLATILLVLAFKQPLGSRFRYLVAVIVRFAWSLTIGLPFFVLGLVAFLLIDILFPTSSKGYVILNKMYKWGSCYWFNGLRLNFETDDYDVTVEKQRKTSNE
ncbi:hypothetical protein J9253_07730 [Thiothrix litoralis]|uniref:Uncharacterized protein n=2 Tax=Thiothrix TaxID=1030 RepID=A0A656HNR5_THINJ|nr:MULTISPECIES: hypothetical protein [Thiothrix]EIJ37000.1 hypothetical protein Thini_4532 [Thiothrix nivea DSM 5205]QTR47797.1 hypothetical protein J9253_07730 [Thiothrix litoralis]